MRHLLEMRPNDPAQRANHKAEIQSVLAEAYAKNRAANMKDVYVTDHQAKAKKYHTNSEEEDE